MLIIIFIQYSCIIKITKENNKNNRCNEKVS